MSREIQNTILLAACFLALFSIAELLYHKVKLQAEVTRKIVHIGSGLVILSFPVLLTSHWSVLFLCTSFFLILLCSLRFNFLKSINAVGRKTFGSLSYPVIIYVCFLVWKKIETGSDSGVSRIELFYLPILILSLADPAAAFAGKLYPKGIIQIGREKKSLSGFAAFFVVAFIISFFFSFYSGDSTFYTILFEAVIIATVSAVTELYSRNGLDNLFIPAVVLITLLLLNYAR